MGTEYYPYHSVSTIPHSPTLPMTTSHAGRIKAIYDERSPKYETPLHIHQAQDYIQLAELKDGDHVLDLACGTSLVTLPAKRKVGQRGHVVGVDISDGMLKVAQRKVQSAGLEIVFINQRYFEPRGVEAFTGRLARFQMSLYALRRLCYWRTLCERSSIGNRCWVLVAD